MKALQFGAGNIGRGFIGLLLHQSGYDVIFADVVNDVVNILNNDRSYTVHILDNDKENILVENIRAINSLDNKIFSEICDADIVTTAVGVGILPKIAITLATGIKKRISINSCKYLNIIACENAVMATSLLKQHIYQYLDDKEIDYANKYIGFADCSVDRIVPPATLSNNMDVAVEKYFEWNISKFDLKGDVEICGANLVDNLEAYIERKLFTLNTGHAICAYLGFLYQKNTIMDAISDKEISNIVKRAMLESGKALVKKHNLELDKHILYIDKILERFKNPYLLDDVVRVGREPLRKLSKHDRLVKPLLLAYDYNFDVENLTTGIAAALHYNNPDDEQSIKLQHMISKYGLEEALTEITNISNGQLLNKISNKYYEFIGDL